MKAREAVNLVLHLVVGAALAALVAWNVWFMVLATAIFATLREQAQHRWIHAELPHLNAYQIEKRTFWDWTWFRWHHAFEIGQWTVGSAVGVGIVVFVRWEWLT